MKRVYHPFQMWEEQKAGMWRIITGENAKTYIELAKIFTGNAALYGEWMIYAVDVWPNSCEHNLTAKNINRQAWIGHAACCLAINCPEELTRIAWHSLSQQQQDEANAMADKAIKYWEDRYLAKE